MSQVQFIVYDNTGRIQRGGTCPLDDVIHQAADSGEWVLPVDEQPDPNAKYIVGGVIVDRQPNSIALTVSGLVVTITGIPVGLRVYIGGAAFAAPVADDPSGTLQVTVPAPGEYTFTIDAFPALPYSQRVTIT